MKTLFARFAKDESGVTVIEYGLIGALIAVVIVTIMTTLSGGLTGAFTSIANELNGV